jgi:energy-coupling factor transport system ATP-binding protein
VLLLDEPTSMLDREATAGVAGLVKDLVDRTGSGVLVVEHRVSTWLDVVDRVVVLEAGGGVVADGPASAVLDRQGAALAAAGVWVPGRMPQVSRTRRGGIAGDLLLRAHDLQVSRRGRVTPVLDGVQVEVRAGTATALTGPNGVGKSTLALVLGGLARPSAGDLTAGPLLRDGLDEPAPSRWRPRDLVRRIGSVFQDPRHQFVAGTVAEELAVGPKRAGASPEQTSARVDELLERLRLVTLARANPFTLSGGEQRRLSVATALATRPRLLVLDEPTFGQDAVTWAELARLLAEVVADGAAVVAATHDEALVEALADSVLALSDGTAVSQAFA